MHKFLLIPLLILSINAKASSEFLCADVYQERTDRLVKIDQKLEPAFGAAGISSAVAFALASGPLFIIGAGVAGTTWLVGYMSNGKLQDNMLIQSAVKEVQVGRDVILDEVRSQLEEVKEEELQSPIDILVAKINKKKPETARVSYDSVVRNLQDQMGTEALCPNNKVLSMKNFVKLLSR